jgi:glycosyltransferase involved in cell wall biosynthesis
MPTAIDELEVFILTYNRAEMLKTAIQSCLHQTIRGISITILDNASTDHTAEIVAFFLEPNICCITAKKNIGVLENIQRCQKLCAKKYVMIFHDDDQLHPTYMERAYSHLKNNPDTNVIVSNFVTIPAQSNPDFAKSISQSAIKLDRAHFAMTCYVRNKIAFCSAVYRKEALESLDFEDLDKRYWKWVDRPIMIEAVGSGSAIILAGTYVFTGRHDSQETHHKKTQPPHTVWLDREKYFHEILGDNLTKLLGICFCVMSHRRLKSGYKRRINNSVTFSAYLADAFAIGAATKKTWRLRWVAPKPVQKMLDTYVRGYLVKNFSIKI